LLIQWQIEKYMESIIMDAMNMRSDAQAVIDTKQEKPQENKIGYRN